MRVLFVVYELPPIGGGVANAANHLLKEFANISDIKLDVVTSSVSNDWGVKNLSKNITLHLVPIGNKKNRLQKQSPLEMLLFTINSIRKIYQLLKQHDYTIAHYFGYPSALGGLLFKSKVPYIVSLRGVDVPGYNKKFGLFYLFFIPLAKVTWQNAKAVIANSKGLKKLALKTAPNIKIDVIPNGVDTQLFKPLPENKKFKKFTVTAGGTVMGPKKGLQYLIRGFAKFHQKHKNTQLLLMGSGIMEKELKSLVKELKIADSVVFTGRLSHQKVAKILPKCHVFCLPSLAEGMSNAVLEAAACGLPLILTDVGGTEEILDGNGEKIHKNDFISIELRLNRIYLNQNLRLRYTTQSRNVSLGLNWSKIAGQLTSKFTSI